MNSTPAQRPIDPAAIRRLLVRSTNWIGDVVMISPALRALRKGFPQAQLDVLARASVAGAYVGHPLVDDVLVEERRSGTRRHEGPLGVLRLSRMLRQRCYDLAVILPKSFGAALAPALAGIPRRVGFPTDWRRRLLTHPVPLPASAEAMHHVEFFLAPAQYLGCPDEDRSLVFAVGEEDRQAARAFLAGHGLAPKSGRSGLDKALIAIHPGASKFERAWSPEKFGQLARALEGKGAWLVVLGAPADRATASQVLREAGSATLDAVGLGGIGTMAALLEQCDLFIGNDSGPMHVAAAVGTPTVAIFGPGAPAKTAPYVAADRHREVSHNFACSPCRQDFFKECDPAPSGLPWCLEQITVQEVLTTTLSLLGSAGDPADPRLP